MNREEWLANMADLLVPLFEEAELELQDNFKMSCGWTSRGARGKKQPKRIGECWSPKHSSNAHTEIFISPIIDDSLDVRN